MGVRTAHWHAPTASGPIDATLALPGSKSMTNRALVLAALADSESLLHRPLRSRDSLLMVAGLRVLGCEVAGVGDTGDVGAVGDAGDAGDGASRWRVLPLWARGWGQETQDSPPRPARGRIDVGNAGTVMRFLPPVAALATGEVAFDGDRRARQRPLTPLLAGLRTLGVEIADQGRGALPLTVHARGRVPGGPVIVDASGSSQFVSGLLLAGARFDKGVEVRHEGPPLPSGPHVAMTVAMLCASGVDVDASSPDVWRVRPGPVRGGEFEIEPDLSNAAPFAAAALVTSGRVRVRGWPDDTTQPGRALRDLLTAMGATTVSDSDGLTVRGTGRIHGIDADLHDVGELAPTLAAVAALAESPSRLRGIAHLRRHETDRLDALARELGALGGDVTQTADGLEIRPRPLHAGVFHAYDDHRIATAGAVLGLAVPGIEVDDIATTGKTLPGFTALWAEMLEGQADMGDGANS